MAAHQLSISAADLEARMRQRLTGAAPDNSTQVVWRDDEQRVLLHLNSLKLRIIDGWLLCNLNLQTDPTGPQRLQFIYFLGAPGEGDGLQAAAQINAATLPAAQLADKWGRDLQRVLWDAVLDGIEVSIRDVTENEPGQPVVLHGFTTSAGYLHVRVLSGAL